MVYMKWIVLLIITVTVLSGYFYYIFYISTPVESVTRMPDFVLENTASNPPSFVKNGAADQIALFESKEYGFSFKYRIKPYGYSVLENSPAENTARGSLFNVTLMLSNQYNQMQADIARGEYYGGPPTIGVEVFPASGVTNINDWLLANISFTNCVEGEVLATVVAGKDAASCLWDGMYAGITVGILHSNKIYLLTGDRQESVPDDWYSAKKDFEDVVASFIVN